MMKTRRTSSRRGLARGEVVVLALVGTVLAGSVPVLAGAARPEADRTRSMVNLRKLGTAHYSYEAEWNGRQWTLVDDNLATFGAGPELGWDRFAAEQGADQGMGPIHGITGINGRPAGGAAREVHGDRRDREPIAFDLRRGDAGYAMGSHRMINVASFNPYLNGRFYDEELYAPDDHVAQSRLRGATGGPNVLGLEDGFAERTTAGGTVLPPVWSSYSMSPAAMVNPFVMAGRRRGVDGGEVGGWTDPWSVAGGFRSPALTQVRYPALKTLMIEQDWLGSARSGVHPDAGELREGEVGMPFRFNASPDSEPAVLFYDGHVSRIAVRQAWDHDARMTAQTGGVSGLWSRDTPFGDDGYFNDLRIIGTDSEGRDVDCPTSFHILTTDGILGRDAIATR